MSTISGDQNDNSISGGTGADRIDAGAGNDTVQAQGGNDTVFGGSGDDALQGGEGDDWVYAGTGNDAAAGEAGNDMVFGGAGADTVSGGGGQNTLFGGADNDTVIGGDENDSLMGGSGADSLAGGGGNDFFSGGAGNDVIFGELGNDSLRGDMFVISTFVPFAATSGSPVDASVTNGSAIALDVYRIDSFGTPVYIGTLPAGQTWSGTANTGETYVLTTQGTMDVLDIVPVAETSQYTFNPTFNDTLDGGEGNDTLRGEFGNDRLFGGNGADSLWGGVGDDEIHGGAGADMLRGDAGNDTLRGDADNDSIFGDDGNDQIFGGLGNDTVFGGLGDDSVSLAEGDDSFGNFNDEGGRDTVFGGSGNDYIIGGGQDDSLSGDEGNDTLSGGVGRDSQFGGAGNDVFLVTDDHQYDLIDGGSDWDFIAYGNWLGTQGVTVTFSGTDAGSYSFGGQGATGDFVNIEMISGTEYGDSINAAADANGTMVYGNGGNDTITGGAGADSLDGGAGADSVFGGGGADTLSGGEGGDFLSSGEENDLVLGGAGADTVDAGGGADTVFGGDGSDDIFGLAGDDQLYGDAGADYIDGGLGNDAIYGGDGADMLGVHGGEGQDTLFGGEGGTDNDTLIFDSGADGAGVNVSYTGAEQGSYSYGGTAGGGGTFTGIESVIGTNGDDRIDASGAGSGVRAEGDLGRDSLTSGAGADSLSGGADDDSLRGGAGNDQMSGGTGEDVAIFTGRVIDYSFDYGPNGELIVIDTVAGRDGTDTLTGFEYAEFDGVRYRLVTGDDGSNTTLQGPNDGTSTLIIAQEGNDWGGGHATSDAIFGGKGVDTLDGGDGDDTLVGEEGEDLLRGDGGRDEAYGGTGRDTLEGGDGDDLLYGGADADTLSGGAGDDALYGDDGDDRLDGGEGSDAIYGGDGADTFYGGAGDSIFGGEGGTDSDVLILDRRDVDSITYGGRDNESGTVTFTKDSGGGGLTFSGIEDIRFVGEVDGTDRSDVMEEGFTDSEGDQIGKGNDTVNAGAGADAVRTGFGDDVIYGGDDSDTVEAEDGNDTLFGGTGDDKLIGGVGDDSIDGGAGQDALVGGEGKDTLSGGAGNDTLAGGGGADRMDGGDDADRFVIESGFGRDTVIGGEGGDDRDRLDLSAVREPVTVVFRTGDGGTASAVSPTGEDNVVAFSEIEEFSLTEGGDGFYAGANHSGVSVDAGGGDDTVYGGQGNDSFAGGDGADELFGAAGNDVIDGGAGDDDLGGDAGDDTVLGGAGKDYVQGMEGNDSLSGGEGADTLIGGEGADVLTGGAGADVFGLSEGGGRDRITDFDMTRDSGRTTDQLDVSDLRTADGNPVTWRDVVVTDTNGDGTGDAVLTFPGGEEVTLVGTRPSEVQGKRNMADMGIPCFGRGTPILTPSGWRAVETLGCGDLVRLCDGTDARVHWAGARLVLARDLLAHPGLVPVRIAREVLGNDRDLLLSQQHAVVMLRDAKPVLVRAAHLAQGAMPGVRLARGVGQISYHHLLLSRHAVLSAGGAAVESLYPGRIALAGMPPSARVEIAATVLALRGGRDRPFATVSGLADLYGRRCLPLLSRADVEHALASGRLATPVGRRLRRGAAA